MTRKELCERVYKILKRDTNKKDLEIYRAIAETDDNSLLEFYEFHRLDFAKECKSVQKSGLYAPRFN